MAMQTMSVYVTGAFGGGRFDQDMATLHVMYSIMNKFARVVLLCEGCLVEILHPGRHHLLPVLGCEGPTCGIIPLANTCRCITTSGLQWNLTEQPLAFGLLISSSNCILQESYDSCRPPGERGVHIDVSDAVLWTCNFVLVI